MRILFLHPNFPGQFREPAGYMAKLGHEVIFLCQTHYGRQLAGVKRVTLKQSLSHEALEAKELPHFEKTLAQADQYRCAFKQLKHQGFNPDVIISHTGWGCGMHSSLIWPGAKRVAYLEWWFAAYSELLVNNEQSNQWLKFDETSKLKFRERNLPLSLELNEASIIVTPTRWQRKQLPTSLQQHCQVIPDGVDLKRFHPDINNKSERPLLTYGTRGMEAMRRFPEFILELPKLLSAEPQLEVEIAGQDSIFYGGKPPSNGSWGNWAKEQLSTWIDQGRVRMVGTLKAEKYQAWLQKSWIHVYLTRPFVVSWSLCEAMASGCCLVVSDIEPIREFTQKDSALHINEMHKNTFTKAVASLLGDEAKRKTLGEAARLRASYFSISNSHKQWRQLLDEELTT
ncbi:MAG: hypothetical protein CMQ19_00200 [Gammaproteobacteria bacterium]|nr:hypothetical protein [Gammaproteobacteria bacterium]